jgi:hypothetical protein
MVLAVVFVMAIAGCRKHRSSDGSGAEDDAVPAGGVPAGTPAPGGGGTIPALVLSEDFSDWRLASLWTTNDPTEIYVDAAIEQVQWKADRLHPQMLSRPIPAVSGNFQLEARIYVGFAANNCHLMVGMSATRTPTLPSISGGLGGGIYVRTCWHGGGVPNHYYFTSIYTEDAANVPYTPWEHDDFGSGPTAGATVITTGTWYRVILKREGAMLTLVTKLDDGTLVGTTTCAAPASLPDLRFVWIGKNDSGDWPWMTGLLDDLVITRLP